MFGSLYWLTEMVVTFALLRRTYGMMMIFHVEGEVTGENFMYYKLLNGGNLLLELISIEGDADLYITGKDMLPSFYPDHYDLHSATCGRDRIYVPGNFKRPVMLGIYGHPSYAVTNFTLRVFQLPRSMAEDDPNTYEVEYNRNDVELADQKARAESEEERHEDDGGESESESREDQQQQREQLAQALGPSREEDGGSGEKEDRPGMAASKRKIRIAGKPGLWAFLEIFEMLFM